MNLDELRAAFDARAHAWDDYTRTPAGRLREELTLHYLHHHLASLTPSPVALDAGGGTGGLAVALARRGFQVHLIDLSAAMIDLARANGQPGDRVIYHCAGVDDAGRLFPPESFDLIACHTLIEYVRDPAATLRTLARLLKPDGLFSLQYVNRHADAMRLAVARARLADALAAIDGRTSQADLFGAPRRTFDRDEARSLLGAAGVESIAEYGVRVFADYLADLAWQTDDAAYMDLVALEHAAALREPYRSIARYGLIIGVKA